MSIQRRKVYAAPKAKLPGQTNFALNEKMCIPCNKSFKKASNFERHMKTHARPQSQTELMEVDSNVASTSNNADAYDDFGVDDMDSVMADAATFILDNQEPVFSSEQEWDNIQLPDDENEHGK